MAANQLTLLRFYGETSDQIPALTPDQLTSLCKSLEVAFQQVAAAKGQSATLKFQFALPPRKGCLEFVFEHAITILPAATPARHPFSAEVASLAVDIATFFYVVVFGNRGVVDIFSKGEVAEPPIVSGPPTIESLKLDITAAALSSPRALKALHSLVATAAASGASKVEIVIPDEPPVTIYSSEERKAAGSLIRIVNRNPSEDLKVTSIQSATGPFLKGSMNENEVTVFLAQGWPASPMFAVVWQSKQPVPTSGNSVDVKARKATRDDLLSLRLEKPLPVSFEDAKAVIIVTGAATYA